jgi:alpha-N-arabinofuranosidase
VHEGQAWRRDLREFAPSSRHSPFRSLTMSSNRTIYAALFCLLTSRCLPAQAPAAHIRVDTNRVIGEVNPRIFGNFAEHLGRCIYGGIFEEGSPLSDADGYRKDVMEAVKPLGVSLLRWPGGNFASGYNWTDGVGPRDQRPTRPDHAWGALETNRFGTDEFLKYCERVGAEPYLCINAGLGTVEQARQWVEYCNESRPTYWAKERAKNGHEKPWNVKIWGLGNEIDGPWQLGHKSPEDYAKFALTAAVAMKREDDSIKLIASGSSNFRAGYDWIGWNRTVLDNLKDEMDYISLHTYIGNPENNFEQFMGESQDLDEHIAIVQGQIRAAQNAQTKPHPIYIAFDEWNTWYRARSGTTEFEIAKTGLEEHYNYEDALVTGMFLNSFFRHADVVKIANLAQLVNVIAPIFTNKQGLFLQTIYFPLAEYGKQRNNASLDVQVTSPTYRIGNRAPLNYLDVSSTYNAASHTVYLNVLNRSEKNDISARIDNVAGQIAGQIAVWEMNNSDLKAVNDFGSEKVKPATRNVTLSLANNGFTYAFPKHSLTILQLKLQ